VTPIRISWPARRPAAPPGEWRRLLALLRPYTPRLLLAAVALLVAGVLGLFLPLAVRQLVDTATGAQAGIPLDEIALALLGLFLVQAGFNFAQSYLLGWVGERLVTDFRQRIYAHLLRLPVPYFNERRTGEVLSRVTNDVSLIRGALTNGLLNVLQQVVTIAGGLTLAVLLSWQLALAAVLVAPPTFVLASLIGRRLRRLTTQTQAQLGEATALLEETVAGVRIVKAFAREPYETGRYRRAGERRFASGVATVRARAGLQAGVGLLAFTGVTAVIWFGSRLVLAGELSPGSLVAFLLYLMMVVGPANGLASYYGQVQEALGAATRLFEILDETPEPLEAPDALTLPAPRGELAFEAVRFGYQPVRPVLRDVSFTAAPGRVVALVGPSGAGKTTLVNLVPRFFDPDAGRIALDGVDLRRLHLRWLRERIAVVPQEPILFADTIRANIAYGRLEAGDAEIEAAARAANAAEFIEVLPDSYATVVGERGVKLSMGQRQRIAIARAILRDPLLLILDEATSSLDNESEALVQEALDRLLRGRTTLVIAHRLSTIESADLILVLDRGRIVEAGAHADLLARRGRYWRLARRRSSLPDRDRQSLLPA
jgi:subfamily B ATP-binding cassette protein MsbA